jgi:UDPglucose 6-dehydrogenase
MSNISGDTLFLGLTHIGQVFSLGWSQKIGNCSVYDFNTKNLEKFKSGELTDEEPRLKELFKKNKKKINICKSKKEILRFKNIFLTLDTPLTKNGSPKITYIEEYLKNCLNYLSKNINLIITSQVYCGFCDDLKKNIFKSRQDINIIYMAETLVMGKALERFIYPERLIFGGDKENSFFKLLKKFNCPIFVYSYREAEMVKIAINLFLLTSVSYANLLDSYCRQFGFKFSTINESIKLDKRIGINSYISPSLGISGGHLERDLHSIIRTAKDKIVKSVFKQFKNLSKKRILLLTNLYRKLNKKFKFLKVVWIGPSYKKESLSILNSPYYHFRKILQNNNISIYTYDSFFDLNKNNYTNLISGLDKKNLNRSLIILNYINQKDLIKLNKIAKDEKIKIIDIGIKKNIERKNRKNIFSLLD